MLVLLICLLKKAIKCYAKPRILSLLLNSNLLNALKSLAFYLFSFTCLVNLIIHGDSCWILYVNHLLNVFFSIFKNNQNIRQVKICGSVLKAKDPIHLPNQSVICLTLN